MQNLIILILWGLMSLFMGIQFAPYCGGISVGNKIILIIILAIGGPFLVITSILESLLSIILPEGWNDDNDDEPKT